MKVEVRPIDTPKWHGKSGKEAFAQPHVIEALYDSSIGGYATGLTEEDEKKYETKLGGNLSNVFNQEEPHPFWNSKMGRVKLENRTMIFDDTKALDYVKIKLMKASKFVANSIKDYESGLYPEATHVIFDEEEDVSIKATKIQKKRKADKVLAGLSLEAQTNLIQILSSKNLRGRSQDFVDVEMEKILRTDLEGFLRYAQRDKKELYVRASILECIHRNILTKEGTAIYYMSDKVGFDFESTVEWFNDPQNQNMKIAILEKLNK